MERDEKHSNRDIVTKSKGLHNEIHPEITRTVGFIVQVNDPPTRTKYLRTRLFFFLLIFHKKPSFRISYTGGESSIFTIASRHEGDYSHQRGARTLRPGLTPSAVIERASDILADPSQAPSRSRAAMISNIKANQMHARRRLQLLPDFFRWLISTLQYK